MPSRLHRSHTAVVVVVVVIRVGSSLKALQDRLTVKRFQGSGEVVVVNVIGEAIGWEVLWSRLVGLGLSRDPECVSNTM